MGVGVGVGVGAAVAVGVGLGLEVGAEFGRRLVVVLVDAREEGGGGAEVGEGAVEVAHLRARTPWLGLGLGFRVRAGVRA